MTITVVSIDQGPFTATGLAQTVAYTFMTLTDEEISVFYDAGAGRVLIDPAAHVVTRNKNMDGSAKEGGTVELSVDAAPAGSSIYLRANPRADRDLLWSDTGSRLKNLNEEQDRMILRLLVTNDTLSRNIDGMAAAGSDAGAASGAAAANVVVAGKANVKGNNLSPNDARDFRFVLGTPWSLPEDFGAVGNGLNPDGTRNASAADDGPALQAWLNSGRNLYLPGKTYRTNQKLTVPTQNSLTIRGDGPFQSVIDYRGASTTGDIFMVGDGSDDCRWANLSNFNVRTATKMTSGAAIRLRRLSESTVANVYPGGIILDRDFVWDGIWFDGIHVIHCFGTRVQCQNDGVIANGLTTGVNLWLIGGCATYCGRYDLHIAGGVGGLFAVGFETMSGVRACIAITNDKAAEGNRELFFDSTCIVDGTYSGPVKSQTGVYVNDPLSTVGTLSMDAWTGNCLEDGIHIVSYPNGLLSFKGSRLFNNIRDGIRIDDATCQVLVGDGCYLEFNQGWGINATVDGPVVNFDGATRSNTLGDFSPFARPWRPWTPALSTTVGAITGYTVGTCRYRVKEMTVDFTADLTITNLGTGAGNLQMSIPVISSLAGVYFGKEIANTQQMMVGQIYPSSANSVITRYDNAFPVATGSRITMQGRYERV